MVDRDDEDAEREGVFLCGGAEEEFAEVEGEGFGGDVLRALRGGG